MKHNLIIVALFFLVVASVVVYLRASDKAPLVLLSATNKSNETGKNSEISSAREHWSTLLSREDPHKVYAEFKNTYANRPFGEQHTFAHVFGEALYDALKTEAIAVCDDAYGFGCYHAVMSRALLENGLDSAESILRACREKNSEDNCEHGLGHGLLSILPYTKDGIVEALRTCDKLIVSDRIGLCESGVFMEFNFPRFEGADRRELSVAERHAPCDSIDIRYIASCYEEQSQWWVRATSSNQMATYTDSGIWCNEVKNDDGMHACFVGLGIATLEDGKGIFEKSVAFCEQMPTRIGVVLCRAGAARSFYYDLKMIAVSTHLCAVEESLYQTLCRTYARMP